VYSLACWGDETDAVQVSLGCSGLTSSVIMDSVKADLDLRFEHAKDGFTRVAVQAGSRHLLVFAAIAGAMGEG
jgi:hypothetical protein